MSQKKHFAGLDGIRAIFCIGIVLYHVQSSFDSVFSQWLNPVYHYGGYFGNYVFFILSGMLIAYHYKKPIAEKKCGFCAFMGRRIRKIYPVYFLSNLFLLVFGFFEFSRSQTAVSFFMLSSAVFPPSKPPYNFPAWFVCVLMFCYLFYYLISALSRRYPRLYLPACTLFLFWGMLLGKKDWNVPLNYRTCGEGYMNFFLGTLLAEILLHETVQKKIVITVNIVLIGAIAAVSFRCGFAAMPGDFRWAVSLLCASLICLAIYGRYLSRLLSIWPLQFAGKRSLSIYLWHIPMLLAFFSLEDRLGIPPMPQSLHLALYFLLLLAVSMLSYRFLEKS